MASDNSKHNPKDDAKQSAKDSAKDTAKDTEAADDTRRRFEEALERKRGRAGAGRNPHDPGHTVVPQSNTKRQRTFRRKSGG